MQIPVPASLPEVIDGYQVAVYKATGGWCTLSASLFEYDAQHRVDIELARAVNSWSNPGAIVLSANSIAHQVASMMTYHIRVNGCDGAAGADSFTDAVLLWH
jgi:hypothetical protein